MSPASEPTAGKGNGLPKAVATASYDQFVECRIEGVIRLSRPGCLKRQLLRVRTITDAEAVYVANGHEAHVGAFTACLSCPEYQPLAVVRALNRQVRAGFRFRRAAS